MASAYVAKSLKQMGQVQNAIVLIYTPQQRPFNDKWKKIVDLYPEAEFNFYKDEQGDLKTYSYHTYIKAMVIMEILV